MFEKHIRVGHHRTVASLVKVTNLSIDEVITHTLDSENLFLFSGFRRRNLYIKIKEPQNWLVKRFTT